MDQLISLISLVDICFIFMQGLCILLGQNALLWWLVIVIIVAADRQVAPFSYDNLSYGMYWELFCVSLQLMHCRINVVEL